MRTLLVVWTMVALTGTAGWAAQDRPAVVLRALQGAWIVTGAEHSGAPMNGLNGGVMTITENRFEIRTASGNMLRGTLDVNPTRTPAHMDMLHADGTVWEAIYRIDGDELRLNYVEKGLKDPRPTSFTTSTATEESLIILKRR